MNPTALITGATAGIGQSTAKLLAKKSWNLILTGRRKDRLEKLKNELQAESSIQVQTLCFDVSNRSECESVFKEYQNELKNVSVLINNAGLARGTDKMDEASLDDWETMVDTNIKGLLFMTRLALPILKSKDSAHIVNIGSVAGRWTYPNGGVYCSTKFAVRAITEGLRMDLNGSPVRVTNIAPGMVETEFSQVRFQDDKKAKALYQGLKPLTPEDIAECIEWSISRPAHVNIQEMVIYPTAQASVTQVHRI